jgi:peptidoglycan L-alanyl-D-glutamate endopeptidase CwlK
MSFSLNKSSIAKLAGVHEDLICIVMQAAATCPVQIIVTDGARTVEDERAMVAAGKSQTMNSRHIGGYAVDLCALIDGKASWDWQYLYQIADAMRAAADELGHPVRWGGCWAILSAPAVQMNTRYLAVKRLAKQKPFLDGPHFELPSPPYPA